MITLITLDFDRQRCTQNRQPPTLCADWHATLDHLGTVTPLRGGKVIR
jgi:hypothetical protein